jgi:hypothetical protein
VERIKEVLYQEEVWIKQRSRVTWLRAGDRNSGFFHARVAQWKRMNTITTLERQDGSVCENPEDVHGEIQGFYTNLYTSQGIPVMDELLALVPERLDNSARVNIDKDYTEEEIKMALFQMHPSKAPGVDGFTAGFFQRHWDLIREDLVRAVLGVLNGGEWLPHINETTIVLIPKVRHPQSIKQFRPISLCNVIYKLCAKTIANRMRPRLEEVISKEQSAFVPGRLITDNALVAFECVHTMKRNKKRKKGMCAVKLDMMKAYDRVEWPFLEAMMLKLGFPGRMVQLIMHFVSSVRFSVKVNGELLPQFSPTRGLR